MEMIEVSVEAIAALTQYYDQLLRCFTFWDFQLAPTIEKFEGILGCPIEGRIDHTIDHLMHQEAAAAVGVIAKARVTVGA